MRRKKNRFQYNSIARTIGRAKAFERPEQDVERAIQSPGRMKPDIQAVSDISNMRNLIRTHISRKGDVGFDLLFRDTNPPAHTDPPATWNRLIGRVVIPPGQIMILQQYLFFSEITQAPAIVHPIMAEPTELFLQFVFKLFGNRVPLQQTQYHDALFAPFPDLQFAGYSVLSQSIADDSDWNSAGHSLIVRNGSLDIFAERISNIAPARDIATVGCRIRGFFVQRTGEKGEER